MNQSFDIIIIGSGPGGYRAAVLGALRNLKVAIIEKHLWGGCCLNRGCVPKKAWHQTASIINQLPNLNKTGLTGAISADFEQAWLHQQQTSEKVRGNYADYMKRLGIQAYEGHGKLVDINTVEVNNGQSHQVISGKFIILATGSDPVFPDGIEPSQKLLSTDELFELEPPAGNEVALIGSGVIATELAFILSKMGKNIHWYARSPILNKSDFSEQAKSALTNAFNKAEISLPEHKSPTDYIESDRVELKFADNTSEFVDWVLFATGRKPHTCKLGLEYTNILVDDFGFIRTNENLQTHELNIYAIGDVRSPVMTANQAIADAGVVIENILNDNIQKEKTTEVPQAVYSCIEMARLGLSEDQAEDEDYEPATGFAAFESSPTAIGQNDIEGFLRVVADMDSGKFLGGEIVGKNAGELIHLMALHKDNNTSLSQFAQMIINHPSRSEEIVNATETLASKWNMEEFIFK